MPRRSSFTAFAIAMGKAATDALKAQRRAEADELKNATARAKLEIQRLQAEALVAHEHNKVMLQDLQIELLKLKIEELSRALGLNSPDIHPTNYDFHKEQKP